MVVGVLRQVTLLLVTLLVTTIYLLSSWLKVRKPQFLLHADPPRRPDAGRRWEDATKHTLSYIRPWRWHKRRLERQLAQAQSYRSWLALAQLYDQIDGRDLWKLEPEAGSYYDYPSITARLYQLREARLNGDLPRMMRQLRENLTRNIGGIGHPALYGHCLVGTKRLIDQYLDEVVNNINAIAATSALSQEDKEQFLADSRQAYGRSALLLSGGASLGMIHWGVLRCLFDHNLLPVVICGGSIGALFCAVVGVHDDAELGEILHNPNSINFGPFANLSADGSGRRKLIRLLKHGVLMDVAKLEVFCRLNLGDVTFAEAFQKTGRVINIFLTHTPHKGYPNLLNHLTTPNVLLWSAATAACAQPGMYAPVTLMAKDMDGNIVPLLPTDATMSWSTSRTVHYSLPMTRLSQLFNVNHFIVSQVNPHVVPFLRSIKSTARFSPLHKLAMFAGAEVLHRVKQLAELGWWPKFLAWMQVEVLQQYEGDITIVPRLSLELLGKVLVNPSIKELEWLAKEGERSVWPYLAIIRSHCSMELALHRATLRLRDAMQTPRASPEFMRPRRSSLSSSRTTQLPDEVSAATLFGANGNELAFPSPLDASAMLTAQMLNNSGGSPNCMDSPKSLGTPTPPPTEENLPPRRRAALEPEAAAGGSWRDAVLSASSATIDEAEMLAGDEQSSPRPVQVVKVAPRHSSTPAPTAGSQAAPDAWGKLPPAAMEAPRLPPAWQTGEGLGTFPGGESGKKGGRAGRGDASGTKKQDGR